MSASKEHHIRTRIGLLGTTLSLSLLGACADTNTQSSAACTLNVDNITDIENFLAKEAVVSPDHAYKATLRLNTSGYIDFSLTSLKTGDCVVVERTTATSMRQLHIQWNGLGDKAWLTNTSVSGTITAYPINEYFTADGKLKQE